MPNWVTNRITAPKHVIQAMLNNEGRIDFSTICQFPGPRNDWDGISCAAEEAAKIVCGIGLSSNPLVASLQAVNRAEFSIKKLRDEDFSQFVGMLENYRACGYLHSMHFAREVWGTKWNACEPAADPDKGKASFETAWTCPEGVLIELSKRFPKDSIDVVFADENIGSNCGTFTLKAGEIVSSNIAPKWRDMSEAEKSKWKTFACEVTGRDPKDYEDEE